MQRAAQDVTIAPSRAEGNALRCDGLAARERQRGRGLARLTEEVGLKKIRNDRARSEEPEGLIRKEGDRVVRTRLWRPTSSGRGGSEAGNQPRTVVNQGNIGDTVQSPGGQRLVETKGQSDKGPKCAANW